MINGVCDKAYQNKSGYFSVLVNDTWYSTGKTDYKHLEGQVVEFNAVQKGKYWNVSGDVRAAAPTSTAGAAPSSPDTRQQSIVLQASYKIAAPVLSGAISAGLLNLGAKNKAYENMLGYLDELAKHIYSNCIDPTAFLGEDDPDNPIPADEEYNPMES